MSRVGPIIGRQTDDIDGDRTELWDGTDTQADTVPLARAVTPPHAVGTRVEVDPGDEHVTPNPLTHQLAVVPMAGALDTTGAWRVVEQSGSGLKARIGVGAATTAIDPAGVPFADTTGRAIRRRQPSIPWDTGSEIG